MEQKLEGIRDWYKRTTRRSIKSLIGASVIALFLAIALFVTLPHDLTLRIQIFNGAWTLPVFGGLWIVAFILLWLTPTREGMFRSQEAMERMEARHRLATDAFNQRLEKIDRVITYLNKAVDDDVIGHLQEDIKSIREKINRETAGHPSAPRRPKEATHTEDPVQVAIPGESGNDNGQQTG